MPEWVLPVERVQTPVVSAMEAGVRTYVWHMNKLVCSGKNLVLMHGAESTQVGRKVYLVCLHIHHVTVFPGPLPYLFCEAKDASSRPTK